MKRLLMIAILFPLFIGCSHKTRLSNNTRPGGYAMGETVALRFSLEKSDVPPDSIDVWVVERKSGYTYSLRAGLTAKDTLYWYSCSWDGRKADGRWPSGGHYLVYGIIEAEKAVFSDTVEIGLAD